MPLDSGEVEAARGPSQNVVAVHCLGRGAASIAAGGRNIGVIMKTAPASASADGLSASRKASFYALSRFDDPGPRPLDETRDRAACAVAGDDVFQSRGNGEILSAGASCHVCVKQRIGDKRCLRRKRLERSGEAAFLRFDVRAGVIGDERRDAILETGLAQEDRSIEGMKARIANIGRIAEVVQPRRRHERVPVGAFEQKAGQTRRLARDGFDVKPSLGQGRVEDDPARSARLLRIGEIGSWP